MKKIFWLLLLFISLEACQNPDNRSPLEVKISNLNSFDKKKDFLIGIFEADQKFRKGQSALLMQKYGKSSKEMQDFSELAVRQDEENLLKIRTYLEVFGHPKKSELEELAAQTPWAVIHHSSSYEVKEKYYPILFQAYLNEDIDDSAMSMYLGRMYRMKFGKRFDMEGPFKSEDEINTLIELLGLRK